MVVHLYGLQVDHHLLMVIPRAQLPNHIGSVHVYIIREIQLLGSNLQASGYLEAQAVWQCAKGRTLIMNEPGLTAPKKPHTKNQKLRDSPDLLEWNSRKIPNGIWNQE